MSSAPSLLDESLNQGDEVIIQHVGVLLSDVLSKLRPVISG